MTTTTPMTTNMTTNQVRFTNNQLYRRFAEARHQLKWEGKKDHYANNSKGAFYTVFRQYT